MGLKYFAPPHIKRERFANDRLVIAHEITHLLVILLPSSLNCLRVYRKFYSCTSSEKAYLIRVKYRLIRIRFILFFFFFCIIYNSKH
jgi:hypothetical protein